MEIAVSEYVAITDQSSVGEARRTGLLAAERLGLDTVKCGEFALLATEISRNVLLHGGGGHTIIFGSTNDHGPVARILALDNGPGIANVAQAMEDGYSTAGTMGAGLGAIKRIASSMEIFTARNGTIVFVELAAAASAPGIQVAGLAVPYPGERFCGDAWSYHQSDDRIVILLVSAEATRNGSMPISTSRVMAEGALKLVCNVDSTRCPVSADSTAICAVSRSRICPTMITR